MSSDPGPSLRPDEAQDALGGRVLRTVLRRPCERAGHGASRAAEPGSADRGGGEAAAALRGAPRPPRAGGRSGGTRACLTWAARRRHQGDAARRPAPPPPPPWARPAPVTHTVPPRRPPG